MSRSCCSIWADEEKPRRTGAPTGESVKPVAHAVESTATDGASLDHAPVLMASDWLALAASPTFAAMALVTGVTGGPAEMLCSSTTGMPLGGMVVMYLLMSAFHLAPWLRLVRVDLSTTRQGQGIGGVGLFLRPEPIVFNHRCYQNISDCLATS
ncbi:hypothetical protein MAUB1S_07421 [Mycolicibacterium aubagnense]